jgi:hypothetical protein
MLNLGSVKSLLQKTIAYFFQDYNFKRQTVLFKRALYTFVLIKIIYWLCYYDLWFGADSIAYTRFQWIGFIKSAAFLLYDAKPGLTLSFILGTAILCLTGILSRKLYFVSDLLLWFLVMNIQNKVYPALTGGDFLLNQFLLFNCFLSSSFKINFNWQNSLRICLHNMAVIALLIQVCLVYLLSALAKTADTGWLDGSAVLTITKVRHFSLFSFPGDTAFLRGLYVLAAYLVLFYQLLFPVFIWFERLKRHLLIAGILMHIYIALVMGLVEFGAIMILGYIYFWPAKRQLL